MQGVPLETGRGTVAHAHNPNPQRRKPRHAVEDEPHVWLRVIVGSSAPRVGLVHPQRQVNSQAQACVVRRGALSFRSFEQRRQACDTHNTPSEAPHALDKCVSVKTPGLWARAPA